MKFQAEALFEQGYRDPNKVKIVVSNEKNEKLYFNLRVELINLIVIEIGNVLTLPVITSDQEETIISCNFAGLKPAYNQRVIRKSIKKDDFNIEDEVVGTIKYAVIRQEPKTGRTLYLTKNGWIKDKIYFSSDLKKFTPEELPTTQILCKNPSCGKEIKPGTKFCPYCGSTQGERTKPEAEPEIEQPKANPEKKSCTNSNCAKEIKASAKFCPFCGSKQTN